MNPEIEKYVIKQKQLQDQIEELFANKKVLQDRICLLNECLSYEKIKQKISELENKQKILTSLESMVSSLKNEIKPLEYLKQILQRQVMISTSTSNVLDIQEQKNSETSQLTVNSGCPIETLDSLSDVSSEDSVMVLSEYDVVSDEEVTNDKEKSVSNKVMYDEALQMACSMHLSLFESITSNSGSIGSLPNVDDQMKDVQSNINDTVSLMSTSNKSEKLLQMYDVANEQDLSNNSKNDEIQSEHDGEYVESTTPGAYQVILSDKEFNDKNNSLNSEEHMLKAMNDSWVKVDATGSLDNSIKNEKTIDICQENIEFQKDNTSKGIIEIDTHRQYNELTNNSKDEIEIMPCLLSSEDITSEYNEQKENIEVDIHKQNGQLINISKDVIEFTPLVINSESSSKECNEQKEKIQIDSHEQNSLLTNVSKDEMEYVPLILGFGGTSKKNDEQRKNLMVETHVQNNILCEQKFESKEDLSNNKDLFKQDICNYVEHNNDNEIHNPVGLTNISENKFEIKSSLLNLDIPIVVKKFHNLSVNTDKPSSINNDEESLPKCHIDKFNIMDLNVKLLNGIRHHGFKNLMTLQQKFLFHCINGRDIIFHSYPCIGKSTMAIISVLQMIDTSLNECQAIVLVPTLELALFVLKMIKSLGKFLNVSTCIGGSNVPRKVSPVPHVVISTPRSLCDMINCNSLCKDFIKMLIVDDAEEIFKCNGFCNNIRHVLLFLNNNPQLIILSTSKLEETFDLFSEIMQNPEYIIVPDEKPSLEDISQYCVDVSEKWKLDAIYELYETLNLKHTIIYCNTWIKSLEIATKLHLKSCSVSAIHPKLNTKQRQLKLLQFQSGKCKLLVTTELLRGEDFSGVLWVVNYDLPNDPKKYVRRIVGCFDRRVKVINFVTLNDTIAKENIETSFNMQMLNLSKNVTDLCTINLGLVNDSIPG